MKKFIVLIVIGIFVFTTAASFAQTLKDALRLTDNEQFEAAREYFN